MFNKDTLGTIALGSQLLGGLFGVKGAYDSAKASREAYAIQSSVARENARISEEKARLALEAGQASEQNTRLRTSGLIGTQRAAMAANGIDLGEGTANDILTTSAYMGERDALTVKDNAARQAWGYRVEGINASNNAVALDRTRDGIDPAMTAAGSLLTTAGSVAGTWYGMKKQGIKMPWE